MNTRSIVTVSAAVLVSCAVFLPSGVAAGRLWQRAIDDQHTLEAVAKRLSVTPDWEMVANYAYCDLLPLGITKQEIENTLVLVGPYQWQKDSLHPYYTVYFDDYFTRTALGDLYLVFDSNDRLTEKLKWIGLGETTPINCP